MSKNNIVLITVDCLRYDRCGFAGYDTETTPFLDSLAEESVVWDNAYAPGPMTPESVPGIIAGLYSHNSAQIGGDIALKSIPDGQPTLASWLSNLGYSTVAALSNTHLTSDRNFDIGFDEFFNPVDGFGGSDTEQGDDTLFGNFLTSVKGKMTDKIHGGERLVSPYSAAYILFRLHQADNAWPTPTGDEIVEQTTSFLDSVSSPVFAWSHFMDVHGPYKPAVFDEFSTAKGILAECGRARGHRTQWLDDAYDSAISYTDQQIEQLVKNLQRRGMWDDTILIVTADHGEALGERGWIGHVARHYLFNELTHVPLLFRHPDYEGRRIRDPVSLAWLSEIIAEAIEVDPPGFPAVGKQSTYFEETAEQSVVIIDGLDEQGHSVAAVNETGKYIAHAAGKIPDEKITDARSRVWHNDGTYYDLSVDPGEQEVLSSDHAENELVTVANRMAEPKQELSSIGDVLSETAEERLKDIGYLS